MQKRFIVTIEIDEKNIAHKYPNYSINFRSSEEFIDLLMNDIVILGDDLEQWGYSMQYKEIKER